MLRSALSSRRLCTLLRYNLFDFNLYRSDSCDTPFHFAIMEKEIIGHKGAPPKLQFDLHPEFWAALA